MAESEPGTAPSRSSGRHRHSAADDDDYVVDESLVAIDDTPTGRHSRLELAAMLAADGRDDIDGASGAAAAATDPALDAAPIVDESTTAEVPFVTAPVDEPTAELPSIDVAPDTPADEGPAAVAVETEQAVEAGQTIEAGAEAIDAGAPGPAVESTSDSRAAADAEGDSDSAAQAAKPSRAGRNLPAAIGVGVGLAALVVASLAFRREAFLVVVLVAVIYACIELRQAFRTADTSVPLAPLVVGGVAMDIAAWARGPDGLVIGLLLAVAAIALWRLGDGAAGYGRDVGAGTFVALYVPFLAGFAVLMAHPSDGAGRIIAFVLAVVCSDVGGYAVGVLFGRHPMAPMVSPKKSWEGFGGSLVACVIAGSLLFALLFHHSWWVGALYGLAIVVTATLGDLGESMLKRGIGIKDMGSLLPGHGGLMDRLDSLLPSAAVAYLLFSAVLG